MTSKIIPLARLALLSLAVVGWPPSPVRAQADPCAADVEKFCKDVPTPGGGRYRCLKEHEKDLSAACKQHVSEVQGRVRGIHDACWEDVTRLCKDAKPGRGRILQCLKAHQSELSEPCKAALAPKKK